MRLALSLAVVLCAAACLPGLEEPVPIQMDVPRARFADFLETPWPSDLLRRQDGTLDLSIFPNPFESQALDEYLDLFQTSTGYSSSMTLFFRVEGGVDLASLPSSPVASVADDASAFLVKLSRPERRIPFEVHTWGAEGTSFVPGGTVAVQPLLGAVVDGPAALVVTTEAKASGGGRLVASEDMRALLECEPLEGTARPVDCTPYRDLLEAIELPAGDVALVQIFSPQASPTAELQAAFDLLLDEEPPAVTSYRRLSERSYSLYDTYLATVSLAQFQAGTPPYSELNGRTGGFVVEEGVPQIQRHEDVELIITVPKAPPPLGGWPVVINGHGTGGSLTSGLGEGARAEAHQLAAAGCAMIATSEPLHSGRAGFSAGGEELATFNFLNPLAGRDNWRQSALEKAQLVAAVVQLEIPASVTGSKTHRFDAGRVGYFGHSQGGIVGSLFVGVEHRILGAFLSGAGAGFAPSLVEKTEPVVLASVMKRLLSLPDDEPLDRFHPIPSLLQIWIEASEPLNYGRAWRHRRGRPTPHLVATSGLIDPYTPRRTHWGLAAAFELPIVEPAAEAIEVLSLQGVGNAAGPARANLRSDDGELLTAGLLQYPDDGHFAVFNNPEAQEAYRLFFETLWEGPPIAQVRR